MKPVHDTARGDHPAPQEGPWNPGLHSSVPRAVLAFSTLFRPENAFTTLGELDELSDFTGLPREQLIAIRPERLVTHELLIRVAVDLSVPNELGSEEHGVCFREMVATISRGYMEPRMAEFVRAWEEARTEIRERAAHEIEARFSDEKAPARAPAEAPGWLARLRLRFRRGESAGAVPLTDHVEAMIRREHLMLAAWRSRAQTTVGDERVILHALIDIVSAMRARHGRVVGDADLLITLATNRACNIIGSERLGDLIEPIIDIAARAEGYRYLPAQSHPVVMNTKGASASGKSSMRLRQQALAASLGVTWGNFAVISPDIFRKYLLDYDSLGSAYKYAGMLTGEELHIVDQKLDRYMAHKAERGAMSHLLIDRFRFDSFAPESDERGGNLLTRFGSEIFMFYIVTPPHATVERAWERGLRVGRYKTVGDLLHHNVEAFSGMPELFFIWALDRSRNVHYEFLDNGVAQGEPPRTIAFGANGALVVLDITGLLDIVRYRKIAIDACTPPAVYPASGEMAPARNAAFLAECIQRLGGVDFADPVGGYVYLRVRDGIPTAADPRLLADVLAEPEAGAALHAVFTDLTSGRLEPLTGGAIDGRNLTLGCWSQRKQTHNAPAGVAGWNIGVASSSL